MMPHFFRTSERENNEKTKTIKKKKTSLKSTVGILCWQDRMRASLGKFNSRTRGFRHIVLTPSQIASQFQAKYELKIKIKTVVTF